jgi:ribosomal protein S18 acetylase RimI-like enzyme
MPQHHRERKSMIRIIEAEEKHIPDITRLWVEFLQFHVDIDPIWTPSEGAEDGQREEQTKPMMASDKGFVLVALDGDEVIGYAISEIKSPLRGSTRPEYGYIHHVAITERYRRSGVGEKMFNEILAWFKSKGMDRIELDITSKNYVSSSFWSKLGFEEYVRTLYLEI